MKRLLVVAISIFSLVALSGVARAEDRPTKQEGRIWYNQNLTLAATPNWSFTVMPGVRLEYARTREDMTGVQFLEFFIGPNYTYKWKDFTFKGSLWYYYMGYPQRGRATEKTVGAPLVCASGLSVANSTRCTPTYNFSHNIEIMPSVEYRWGRWSFYDRIIFHNTFYADFYTDTNPNTNPGNISVGDQRYGWGTVLRELVQGRYALTDRLGVLLADELFFGIIEDSDTKGLLRANPDPKTKAATPYVSGGGFNPMGYWKDGLRYNRTYLGIDYKVTPALTVTPMYMMEIGLNPVDSGDVTDIAHNIFVIVTYVAKMFDDKK
jgi:hypothetical protein